MNLPFVAENLRFAIAASVKFHLLSSISIPGKIYGVCSYPNSIVMGFVV